MRHGSRGTGDDWLFAGLAASITGFGVGMLTFDAFSFTQVTFVFWILLGLSAAMLRINEEMGQVREFAPAPRRTRSLGAPPRSRRSARRFPLVGAGARRLAQVAIEVASETRVGAARDRQGEPGAGGNRPLRSSRRGSARAASRLRRTLVRRS